MYSYMSQKKLFVIACIIEVVFCATRSLSVRNSCPEPVRVGFTAGAIPSTSCSTSTDCPSSGVCSVDTKLCYYPSFLPGGFLDLQKGEIRNLNISVNKGDLYSGAVFVSTGCNTYQNSCETGICRDKSCALTAGAVGPHTRAEFTFDPAHVDFYDISLMHGANVPMSMIPSCGKVEAGDSYSCGPAGSVTGSNTLSKCTYGYNAISDSSNILFVAAPDLSNLQSCSSDSQCNTAASGLRCGLAAGRDPTGLPTADVVKVCGKVVGMWSSDEVCVYTAGQYAADPYTCNKGVSHGTYTDLYGCSGAYVSSGYQPNQPVDTVCGCYNWESAPSDAQKCVAANPEWLTVAYPWVKMIKDMCPTAYSYAYDDMTSTFTCAGGNAEGDLTYEIEFCPDGIQIHQN